MKKNYIAIFIIIFILVIGVMAIKNNSNKFSIEKPISNYNLSNSKVENDYLNFLKKNIYPEKIRNFIENDFVPTSLLNEFDTGKEMIELMEFDGYKYLFTSMFDKERTDFEDCPVTENFKKKFNTNLLYYFNLNESEDCESYCLLNKQEQDIIVKVFGNFKNTEPMYWTTHHFKYTLDDEGNVDDVTLDYTE
ncbi:MAG: hypothetical protein IJP71_04020 [Lachnospiraceae bacterium]|nr:hypothetical protein [Lachnospiraceae bacterium]